MQTWTTTPPDLSEYAPYYRTYTSKVPSGNILDILSHQLDTALQVLGGVPPDRETFRYAPDKWSIREVVGHLADTERVFALRALAFARSDPHAFPAMEQDDYVAVAGFDARPLSELIEEFSHQRKSNVVLFRSFDDETAARAGTASGVRFTARCIPYIMAGHVVHHLAVLRERYL